LLVCQLIPSDALARSRHIDAEAGDVRFSFLSAPENQAQQAAEEPSRAMPQENNQNYDGTWTFTGADCPNTGAVSARIIGEKVFVRQVDPDGTLHSVGLEMARHWSNYPIAHLRERKLIPSTTRRCEGRGCLLA